MTEVAKAQGQRESGIQQQKSVGSYNALSNWSPSAIVVVVSFTVTT